MVFLWLLHIGLITLLSRWAFKVYQGSPAQPYFWYGVLSKILAGVLFGLLYKFHFQGGDTWSFYESSRVLASWMPTDPTGYLKMLTGASVPDHLISEIGYQDQPRALLMIKILSILSLITGGNYWLSSAYLSLFAFCGLWSLVNSISRSYPGSTKAAVGAFIFFPGTLFWSSGVSKETLFIGVFGYLSAWYWPYFKRQDHHKYYFWLLALVMVLVLFQLKYYYMAVLIPVLIATMIQSRLVSENQSWLIIHGGWLLIFAVFIFCVSWLHPNLRFDYIADVVKNNSIEIISKTDPGTSVSFLENHNPAVWVGINLPWAIVTGLFRPNLGDWGSFLQNIAVLENLIIVVLLIGRLSSLRKKEMQVPEWFPCLFYVLMLAGLLTLSTPNFGTLVRYKVSFISVFIFLILYKNPWWDRLTAQLP